MDKNIINDNFKNLVIKIIDYLNVQQTNNNTNELIPTIDINSNLANMEPNDFFNKNIKMWQEYYKYQYLISKELLIEIEEDQIYDGILISNLNLCRRRLINKELGDKDFGCIRVDDTKGIYFEKTITKNKENDSKEDIIIAHPTCRMWDEKELQTIAESAAEIWKNHSIFDGAIPLDEEYLEEKRNENSRKK